MNRNNDDDDENLNERQVRNDRWSRLLLYAIVCYLIAFPSGGKFCFGNQILSLVVITIFFLYA